jgi:hypothetical protein
MAADLGLDPVQLPDPAQRLLGQVQLPDPAQRLLGQG